MILDFKHFFLNNLSLNQVLKYVDWLEDISLFVLYTPSLKDLDYCYLNLIPVFLDYMVVLLFLLVI